MKRIARRDIADILALTPMQEGMLFHYLKNPGSDLYFEQLCLQVSGEIDINSFEQAWNFVVDTNEMLRTIFRWEKMKKPIQVIFKQYPPNIIYWDISDQDSAEKKKRVNEIKTKDKVEKFDLHNVPFRITLIKIAKARHEIIISNHHILYDGWSSGIILDEFFTAYTDLYHNKIPLKPIKNRFKEYIQWIHEQEQGKEEKYWREYLKGFDTPTELSIKQKSRKETSGIETLSILFNQDTGEQLERYIHHYKITMAALLYGTWALLLQRYNNSDQLIFGTTVSGRTTRINGIEHMVGLFINTLPLRIRFHAREKTAHWLKRIHETLQTREAYESTPLVRTKEYSQLKPDEILFDTIVVIENYPLNKRFSHDNGPISINSYSMFEMTNYDLTVGITLAGEIRVNFIYNRECLEKDTIQCMTLHFKNILMEISQHPGKRLHEIEILSEKEKRKILNDFNDSPAEYSEDKVIHQLFEEQVERTPDHIALIGEIPNKEESFERIPNARGGNISITYRELNEKANQLAQMLREKGIKPDTIVAIMVERSLEMVIGIMCILKAGGAYLPIDPGYPEESIRFILADSRPDAVISLKSFTGEGKKVIRWEGKTIFLDEGNMLTCPTAHPHLSLHCCASGNSLAYVIYTSGSTGKPKGVMVEHASVVNLLNTMQNLYPLTQFDTYLLKTSYIFDVSVTELFGWFWQGGRLAILDIGGEKDPKKIIDIIECRMVTHVNFVPSMFNAFVDGLTPGKIYKLSSLKYIFLAGEALLPELVNKFNRFHLPIVLENIYGPTEATVYSSHYSLSDWCGRGNVPIGKPLSNIKLYILDRNSHLQPVGVPGELVITGVGLARGYLNRPGLSAEKFTNSLYQTGDLARWQPDGNIEFLGRMDYQVKIRGFRVELEEIESKLLAHKNIKAAVVVAREDKWGERYLAAYWVSSGGHKPSVSDIKEYLSKLLPDYMIPGYFVNIEKIPLTVSGKIDRKALPSPGIISRRQYTPPQSELQEKLVAIWWEVLGIEKGKIGINDNFFELGGHSLKAIGLAGRLHREFDIEIPLATMFQIPTVRELSEYICRSEKSIYRAINPVEEKEYYPLSAAQKSQFVLHGMDKSNMAYNMTGVMKLEGEVKKGRLEETFKRLIERQVSLRTFFEIIDNNPMQRIHDEMEFEIEYYCVKRKAQSAERKEERLASWPVHFADTINNFIRPFDLSKAPLIRIGLINEDNKKFLLLVDMHHIISDGVSVQVLVNDFMGLYAGEDLTVLKLQYKDFSVWQNKQMGNSALKRQEAYWTQEFAGEIPVLNLCTDFPRPGVRDYAGDILELEIGSRETAKLKHLAHEEKTTLFMLLFALFYVLMAKISGQEEILVGTPIVGRTHTDWEPIIGMFVNTLAIRNYPTGEKTFPSFLHEVKRKTLLAFENQEYPFEELVKNLEISRDTGRNPLFDVMFAYKDINIVRLEAAGLKLKACNYKSSRSKFDITLLVREHHEKLQFSFEYSTGLFKEITIGRFIQYFKNIISRVLIRPQGKISGIEVISIQEKQQILLEFNNSSSEYPKDEFIHQLFEKEVEKRPYQTAVVYKDQSLMYSTLNRRANRLAAYLMEKGVRPDSSVGIMLYASIEVIIGVLAILKAGAAYLPIDPDYPQFRTDYMLADSNANVLVTTGMLAKEGQKARKFKGKKNLEIIFLESLTSSSFYLSPFLPFHASQSSLAYVIYTSGSTGRPKGVMVEHRNVIRLIKNTNYIDFKPNDRILQTGALEFDASTFEIWGALLNGLTLYLAPKEKLLNPGFLKKIIILNNITTIWLTAPLFNQMVQSSVDIFAGLENLLVGGDILSPPHINQIRRRFHRLNIINGYGPTENTTFSTTFLIEKEYKDNIPIGKPIANSTAYIVDKNNHLQPIGIAGELWVGGDGVSRGYLNNPELTAEKFDHDLWDHHNRKNKSFLGGLGGLFFKKAPRAAGCKLYKTGDLSRWFSNGNIQFLGRIDHQVKIRGFRIEPKEIECCLLNQNYIIEAVVQVRTDETGEKYLCAYLVSRHQLILSELRKDLSANLPDYMIPSYFVMVDKIPLTRNGKVDWRALPEPEKAVNHEYVAPRDAIEKKLVEIWKEVLGGSAAGESPGISINANFFELGGHSLKASLLMSKIHKIFDVNISLTKIFISPTILELAAYIKETAREKYIPINPTEKKEYYVVSSAQRRLYVLQQMDEQGIGYNIPFLLKLEGRVNKDKLENTFQKLINKHEGLRTSFETIEEKPVQQIHEEVDFEIEYYNMKKVEAEVKVEKNLSPRSGSEWIRGIAPLPEGSYQSSVIRHLSSEFIRPFDLSQAPLLRVRVIKLPHPQAVLGSHPYEGTDNSQEGKKGKYIFMVDMHHIISDGMSVELLINEFTALYIGRKLPWLKLQYRDYSEWQNRRYHREELKEQEAFWQQQLTEEIPQLQLPTDFIRPKVLSFEGKRLNFEITNEETNGLKELALKEGTTLYILLLSMFNVFLSKITSQEAIVVGTAVAGRRHADLEKIFGMFVNTLALINYPASQKPFNEFLRQVNRKTLQAFENQDYPFEKLVEIATLDRDTSRNPLFDVMFALQPLGFNGINLPGLSLYPYDYETNLAKFDLMLQAVEQDENLSFTIEYRTSLFKELTIQRFIGCIKKIIAVVLEQPEVKLMGIEFIPEIEKEQLLSRFNNTSIEYPKEKLIHQLFEEGVEKRPDQIAVVYRDQLISYHLLNQWVDKLAGYLRSKGVKSEEPVGIIMKVSLEMIVAVLAILKAGSAYLPIDPDYPAERIKYMLDDSKTRILLPDNKNKINTPIVLDFKHLSFDFVSNSESSISDLTPSNLAYIIYTSGTTGKPKGVMVQHANVVRLFFNNQFQFNFTERDVWTMFHSYCFDFSVWEMYGALLFGGKLVLIDKMTARDTEHFLQILKREGVTVLNQTPSAFYRLLEEELKYLDNKSLYLKYVIFGGEALNPSQLKEWKCKYPETRLINMYGITETTVHVTYKELTNEEIDSGKSNIGKPIPTLSTYIMNKDRQLMPIGTTGELCIGGAGVSRGYLNHAEWTTEKFIENPYKPGETLYCSGDLVRYLENGDMQYQGRMDHQVKIRGYRIELGEIERCLSNHNEIDEAVVMAREEQVGEKYLCAYVVSKIDIDTDDLRAFLHHSLPEYMLPAVFVPLEKLPLTPNGKIDLKALPEPKNILRKKYTAPRNGLESKLIDIWASILNQSSSAIGIHDNFFQLGGHSLKATLLASKINKIFDVNIPLTEIFTSPTVRELAAYIKEAVKARYQPIASTEKKEYFVVSSAQKRLYILQQMDPMSIAYNIPSVFELEGGIDETRLKNTFRTLIKRHENFRTSFELMQEKPVQKIHDEVEFEIEYFDFYRTEVEENEGTGGLAPLPSEIGVPLNLPQRTTPIIKNFIRFFDLSQVPLLRVGLIRVPEDKAERHDAQKHIMMVDMHHIISDGISIGIMIKEFKILYEGEELPELLIQYKEFSEWQNRRNMKGASKEHEEYWVKEFKGEIPVLNLPIDYNRPVVQCFEGHLLRFEVTPEETAAINKYALEKGVTLFMLLLSIYMIFLSKLTNQEDIVVGIPVSSRQYPDLENIMGMFVNTLAIRSFPKGEKTFGQFLSEIKNRTLKAFAHQDYPYEELVSTVAVNRDTSRNPLFDTMFTLQNMEIVEMAPEIPGVTVKPYHFENKVSMFDMSLTGTPAAEKLVFSMEYCTKLFKPGTIERWTAFFKKVVHTIISDPGLELGEIEIMAAEEKQQVLFAFNDTHVGYTVEKTIDDLFAGQVKKTPDLTALVDGDISVTYKELNSRSSQLAYLLKEKGLQPDTIVGIMVERSIEMIVGILGILKADGAYLPIDPNYPEERVSYMLEDSGVKILIEKSNIFGDSFVAEGIDTIYIDDATVLFSLPQGFRICPNDITNHLNLQPAPITSLAYIIYTSGSTGKPKGVMIEHQQVVSYLQAFYKEFEITSGDTVIQQASFTFDAFVEEIFPVLLRGGTIALPSREEILDVDLLTAFISKHNVNIIDCTPLLLNELNKQSNITHVKLFISGGDILKKEYITRLLQRGTVYNTYGPTETTVCATYYKCEPEINHHGQILIGKPIANYQVYIIDQYDKLVPIGIPGQLCVSGSGVSRGYLNQPELTAERFKRAVISHSSLVISNSDKFFPNDQCPMTNDRSYKLYQTGDLARWLPDGNIEFLGRIDQQVKIRGYRIELGEIENELLYCNKIKETVVLAVDDENSQKCLCAYIVTDDLIDRSEVRAYLGKKLPGYMIPAYFVQIAAIPITSHGKVNREALPDPRSGLEVMWDAAPEDEVEKKLMEIWANVLFGQKKAMGKINRNVIGMDTNFFELGGHSLKAMIMVSRIQQEFNVKVPLARIFKTPFIRELSRYIRNTVRERYISVKAAEEKDFYELSFNQRRLWIIHQFEPSSAAYNMPETMVFTHHVDENVIKKVLQEIIKRHDSFRTGFKTVNKRPVQFVVQQVGIPFKGMDISSLKLKGSEKQQRLKQILMKEARIPFNLTQPPLFKSLLVKVEEEEFHLVFNIHHIISDGWSMEILEKEFQYLYERYRRGEDSELEPLQLQYKDFSEWQNKQLENSEVKKQSHEFWGKILEKRLPVIELPTDSVQDSVSREGAAYRWVITEEIKNRLNQLARNNNTSLFVIMLALFNLLLSQISGQKDIALGFPASGRDHISLHKIVGFFVNTVILNTHVDHTRSFTGYIHDLHINVLEVLQHQDYPLELVADDLNMKFPEINIFFNMLNLGNESLEKELDVLDACHIESVIDVKFDLMVYISEYKNAIEINCNYKRELFSPPTIVSVMERYSKITNFFTVNPGKTFNDYKRAKHTERKRLLKRN